MKGACSLIDYDKILTEKVRNLKPSGIRKFFDLAAEMEKSYGLKTDRNEYLALGRANVLHHLPCENGFALRLECAPFYFAADKVAKIKTFADVMNRHFEPGVEKPVPQEMISRPKECFGFEDYKN